MKKIAYYILITFVFVLCFSACDDFFSSSFGTPRSYNEANIDINAGNVDEWLRRAVGNPELAAAITRRIIQELANNDLPAPDRAILLRAGISIAVESSGLRTSLITNVAGSLGDLLDDDAEEGIMIDMLNDIRDDFNKKNGKQAADNIATMAYFSIDYQDGKPPTFDPAFSKDVGPVEVVEAVMVLLLGELGSEPIRDDFENIGDLGLHLEINGDGEVIIADNGELSDNVIVLAAYLNLIITGGSVFDENPLTAAIRTTFLTSE
jgi:hypothetical protein